MTERTPAAVVAELDKHIIGQNDAKKAVAVALRNRWRRQQLGDDLREEVLPKNILMIGPTGVGKTEIARRLARLANAPFIKMEATKFTEVGYVGRDVEQIIRDLLDAAMHLLREKKHAAVRSQAEKEAKKRIIDALVGEQAGAETREKFLTMLEDGDLDEKEIEIELSDAGGSNPFSSFDIPGMPGAQMGMINISDMLGKAMGGAKRKKQKLPVNTAFKAAVAEEMELLLDQDALMQEAIDLTENQGIVFLDEIDKICGNNMEGRRAGDVSREGVQRDLLPLIEGTTVSTRHGPVKTDHILFIASGAFHLAKPSDLLPELQGRLPTRVQLRPLTVEDFRRILTEPKASLIEQHQAMLATEGLTITFDDSAIDKLAELAAELNETVENIGARRLHTVLEKVLEEVSFNAPDKAGESVTIDAAYVAEKLHDLQSGQELNKFIL